MGYDARFPLVRCPVCDSTEFSRLADAPPAVQCTRCGLGIEQSVSDDPTRSYAPAVYDATRDAGVGSNRWVRFHHDCAVAADRMRQLAGVLEGVPPADRTWLDVGAGNGATLVAARRRGWRVAGVEADHAACRDLTDLLGIPTAQYGVWAATAAFASPAGVVSFFDVLEHLLDPPGAAAAAAAALVCGGLLVVEVPDLDAAEDFRSWKHRRVSTDGSVVEHQYHFGESALATLVDRYAPGLVPVHVARPLPGRLQAAWRKPGLRPMPAMTADELVAAAATHAQDMLRMSPGEREATMMELRRNHSAFAAAVERHLFGQLRACEAG